MPGHTLIVEKRWSSHAGNVQCARQAVRHFLSQSLSPVDLDLVELAVGEACANAVEHGSPHGVRSEFIFRCFACANPSSVVFEVEDQGSSFSIPNSDQDHRPDLSSEGGRGLFLIDQIMDQVTLATGSMGATLRMIKRLPADQVRRLVATIAL